MANYKEAYLRYMDANGIKYRDEEEFRVRVAYNCKNLKTIAVIVMFDRKGNNLVQFACTDIASFNGDKYAPGVVVCNSLNNKYRWVKFYLDDECDLMVGADAIVDMDTVGPVCCEIVQRMVDIIDAAYPDIMRANLGL